MTRSRRRSPITVGYLPCPKCGQRHDRTVSCEEARDVAPKTKAVSTFRKHRREAQPSPPPRVNSRVVEALRLLRARPHGMDYEAIRESMDDEGVPQLGHTDEQAAQESAYTKDPTAALTGEPEAISERDQELLSKRARDENLAQLEASRERLLKSLEEIEDHPQFPSSSLRSELAFASRRMESVLEKVERRIRTAESRPT